MYVTKVPNRNSPPAILLRESYRENGKVKNRTLANLTGWSAARIAALKRVLKNESVVGIDETFEIVRSRPHGHVAAVRGILRQLGLHKILAARSSRRRDLVEAMIVARLLDPRSKLATARGLDDASAFNSLGVELNLVSVEVHELYDAMDWLLSRQPAIEKALAQRHLSAGGLALYDLSSTWFEGRHCELAKRGYPRGGGQGKEQVNFGLLCAETGCPVSVEVFPGNVGDPATVCTQVAKIRGRFELNDIVLVGDRGMLTSARIREDLKPNDVDWITSLRAPQIRKLEAAGAFQLSLFDEMDLAEVTHESFPGERLIVCKNPLLAAERRRKRKELLDATEKKLAALRDATQRTSRPLTGKGKIGVRLGRVLERSKMGKHFRVEITEDSFSFHRDEESIRAEAALDGIYVIRTSVDSDRLSAPEVVGAYKALHHVERAFRCHKTVDLRIRPIYHRDSDRVRAHFLLCFLSYYVEWHMRRKLAPLMFDDHDRKGAAAKRRTIVSPALRSDAALHKAASKLTEDGYPVHSFRTLLADLATITRNTVRSEATGLEFERTTRPTGLQTRALQLLQVCL